MQEKNKYLITLGLVDFLVVLSYFSFYSKDIKFLIPQLIGGLILVGLGINWQNFRLNPKILIFLVASNLLCLATGGLILWAISTCGGEGCGGAGLAFGIFYLIAYGLWVLALIPTLLYLLVKAL